MNIDVKTADGVKICVGLTYHLKDGEKFVVDEINHRIYIDSRGAIKSCTNVYRICAGGRVESVAPNDLYAKKPEPDSWAKLEEDAGKSYCKYFGKNDEECFGCPNEHGETCSLAKAVDIVRRAKKLAGVE